VAHDPHRLENLAAPFEGRAISTHEDRQGARLGVRHAPEHRGVQDRDRGHPFGRGADRGGTHRRHVDQDRPRRDRVRDTLGAEEHLLQGRRIGEHRDDDLGISGSVGRGRRGMSSRRDEPSIPPRGPVPDPHVMAGVDESARHRGAHRTEAEERDAPHPTTASSTWIRRSPTMRGIRP
jgi:hypothetical protein